MNVQPPPGAALEALLQERAEQFEIIGCKGSSDAYLLARRFLRLGEPMLALVDGEKRAEAVAANLTAFLGQENPYRKRIGDEGAGAVVLPFPASGATPFDGASPSGESVQRRILTLSRLAAGQPVIVVASLDAAMERLMPKRVFEAAQLTLKARGPLDLEALQVTLAQWGYSRTGLVEDPGNYSLRGGILDIFSPLYPQPVRADLFGDTIDTLRFFEPGSQRSTREVAEVTLRPVREIVLSKENCARAQNAIREYAGRVGTPRGRVFAALDQLEAGMAFSGMEDWLTHFYGGSSTLFDYLSPNARLALLESATLTASLDRLARELGERRQQAVIDGQLAVEISDRYLSPEEFSELIQAAPRVEMNPMRITRPNALAVSYVVACRENDASLGRKVADAGAHGSAFEPIVEALGRWKEEGWTVALTAHTTIQLDRLAHLLELRGIPFQRHERMPPAEALLAGPGTLHLILSEVFKGFQLEAERLTLLAEDEVFGRKIRQRVSVPATQLATRRIDSYLELAPGDLVVHVQHGIGRFIGLKRLSVAGEENDFLEIHYRGDDKIFLPIFKIRLVQKYAAVAEEKAPPLDQLGGKGWESRKRKAKEAVEKLAKELLALYALRMSRQGIPFVEKGEKEEAFAAAFPYTETVDQSKAIAETLADMGAGKPMDRLICGDVGFGKTEVAMRAAYRAVSSGYQATLMAPTTVLVLQHYLNFKKRFESTPYRVEYVNRFRAPGEIKQVLEACRKGEIDILIGTHRLLSKDVRFANLGLLIIDEEQRFGVAHKEKIKSLRSQVDVLTMSATPIPRTLNLSLSGIRDISIIQTPPTDRVSVRTFLTPFNEHTIREAVLREIGRGGQMFFVHNRVESIHTVARRLEKLVPEARIAVGHAQMHQHHLEDVMLAFWRGEFNILVCTTIIESGLDIPNANTIFIDRPHALGLAQLYQLRGRVGRSNRRAYCYLLLDEGATLRSLAVDARRRIEAILENAELGSSFQIAARDMEIRGVGEFLGQSQSGHATAVGYDLYMRMLEEKVQELRGDAPTEEIDPEASLGVTSFLPDNYIPEERQRLRLYRRILDAEDTGAVEEMAQELEDRFGPAPAEVKALLETARLRLRLKKLRVISLVFRDRAWWIRISPDSAISGEGLMRYALLKKGRFKPDGTAILPVDGPSGDRFAMANQFLDMLLKLKG